MTYRVVQDEPCELDPPPCQQVYRSASGLEFPFHPCSDGCNGDGTRTVEVAVIERAPDWWWSPTEQAATAGTWGHGDDRAVWVEVDDG